MASIKISTSVEEQKAVLNAILYLNDIRHIKAMSQAQLATLAGIRPTKVRHVLIDLIEKKLVNQYQVSQNKRIQRYYYVLTNAGFELLEEEE